MFIILTVVIVLCVYRLKLLKLYSLFKYKQFMLHQLFLNKAVIKLASIKQKVEEDVFGPFLMILKLHQGDYYLHCLHPNLAVFWCRKIANFNSDFLFERLLNRQCIYFEWTNCF